MGEANLVISVMGLSGAGKTTLAHHLAAKIREGVGKKTWFGDSVKGAVVLDGDDLRRAFPRTGRRTFDTLDRVQQCVSANVLGCSLTRQGLIPIISIVNPVKMARTGAADRAVREGCRVALVYLDVPLEVCSQRCVHSVYKDYEAGRVKSVAGIDFPFEQPEPSEDAIVIPHGYSRAFAAAFVMQAIFVGGDRTLRPLAV